MTSDWHALRKYDQWLLLLERETRLRRDRPGTLSRSTVLDLLRAAALDPAALRDGAIHSTLGSGDLFFASNARLILLDAPLSVWSELFGRGAEKHFPFNHTWISHLRLLATHLQTANPTNPQSIDELVRFLLDALSWIYLTPLRIEQWQFHLAQASLAHVAIPSQLPILVTFFADDTDSPKDAAGHIHYLQDRLAADKRSRLLLNVLLGSQRLVAEYMRILVGNDELIILDEARLKRVFLSQRYSETIRIIVRGDLSLRRLNPYGTEKPVAHPDMFFGRQRELDRILQHPDQDFMIIGSRRIGKSSLCTHLGHRCEKAGDRIPIYVDAAACESEDHLIKRLTAKINIRRAERITLRTFSDMVATNYSLRALKYLFLIDEIDPLLRQAVRSGDWRLFEVLRELSQRHLVQTVFTGYRHLYDQWQDLRSPLYNYASPIVLSTLDEVSARRLILDPMHAIGVAFKASEQRAIVEHILTQTGRYPSFVQFFCGELINHLAEGSLTNREISWANVDAVHQLRQYREFVLKPYRHDENFSALEKLILLKVAVWDRVAFTVEELLRVIEDQELSVRAADVIRALSNLELAGLIRTADETVAVPWEKRDTHTLTCYVAIPAFPMVLRKTEPVDREIRELSNALKRNGGKVG